MMDGNIPVDGRDIISDSPAPMPNRDSILMGI